MYYICKLSQRRIHIMSIIPTYLNHSLIEGGQTDCFKMVLLCRWRQIHSGTAHPATRRQAASSLACLSKSGRKEEQERTVVSTPGRREVLLSCSFLPPLAVVAGSDDAKTLFNCVLSAYGLPTLKGTPGYKIYDELSDDFYFEYPRSWVVVPNRLRTGVYISDYQVGGFHVLVSIRDGQSVVIH